MTDINRDDVPRKIGVSIFICGQCPLFRGHEDEHTGICRGLDSLPVVPENDLYVGCPLPTSEEWIKVIGVLR